MICSSVWNSEAASMWKVLLLAEASGNYNPRHLMSKNLRETITGWKSKEF